MPTPLLTYEQIATRLAAIHAWRIERGELVRDLLFEDFRGALAFVNRVGELAEAANHHPDIDIRYNKVKLALMTHSAGGLTEKDFSLAQQIDSPGQE